MSEPHKKTIQQSNASFEKINPENHPQIITQPTIKNASTELLFLNKNKTSPSSPVKNYQELRKSMPLQKSSYSCIPMRKDVPAWNQSAAVLRNTSPMFSLSKEQRFPDPKIAYYNHYQIQYPSSLSNRKTTFGYGNKASVPEVFKANRGNATKDVPFYEVDDMVVKRNKSESFKNGKTFGQSWSTFKSVRTPHRSTVHISQQVKANPGPKYLTHNTAGSTVQKNKMHERLRMFSQQRAYHKRYEPGPQNYLVSESQTKKGSLKTDFGKGTKSDFTKNGELAKVPGPIYNIAGFADKFSNTKLKNMSLKKLKRL